MNRPKRDTEAIATLSHQDRLKELEQEFHAFEQEAGRPADLDSLLSAEPDTVAARASAGIVQASETIDTIQGRINDLTALRNQETVKLQQHKDALAANERETTAGRRKDYQERLRSLAISAVADAKAAVRDQLACLADLRDAYTAEVLVLADLLRETGDRTLKARQYDAGFRGNFRNPQVIDLEIPAERLAKAGYDTRRLPYWTGIDH